VVEPRTDALMKSVEHLLAEREAVAMKEKELIDGLNAVLAKMGYQVVATSTVPMRPGRPPGRRRGPGRPAGSGNGRRRWRRRGRPPKEEVASRRPGRPRKAGQD
jgi:hypothetical protein